MVQEYKEMSEENIIHIVRLNIDPICEKEFNEWYDNRHLPDILSCPGWLSGRRFRALGEGPKYAAIYQVAGEWAFATPEYKEVAGFFEFTPHVRDFSRIQLRPILVSKGEKEKEDNQ
ncbi:MAG: hypothetical protein ACTHJQ_27065 [Rhizobiaceae bacterium]